MAGWFETFWRDRRRAVAVAVVAAAGATLAAGVLAVDPARPPGLVLFLGRFHPAVVHFPIGALVLAALLECAAALPRFRDLRAAVPFVLLVAALSALAAVVAGYFLSLEGEYDATLLSRHRWLGLGVLGLTAGSFVLAMAAGRRGSVRLGQLHRLLLATTAALVLVTSHYGGTLTRGPGYLTHYLPAVVGAFGAPTDNGSGLIADIDSALVFDDLILPVLERRCVQCHGSTRSRGGLRLDGRQGLERGSANGPALVAGNPGQSELVRRIVLPPHHDEAMPPDGEPPLDIGEIELVRWWIAGGASFSTTVGDLAEAPTSVETYLARRAAPRRPQPEGIFALAVPDAEETAVAEVERAGFSVRKLAPNAPFVVVTALPIRTELDDAGLQALDSIRDQIASLDLSASAVGQLELVGRMPHLTELHLQRTRVTDDELAHLAGLAHLELLNVHGTAVSDAGLERLTGLTSLRRLYVWQTEVSDEGVAALRARRPDLDVNVGGGFAEPGGADSGDGVTP